MQIKSAYNRLDGWTRKLSTIQYALVTWLVAFSLSVPVGLAFPGISLVNATMVAAGGATGVAIAFYFMGKPER